MRKTENITEFIRENLGEKIFSEIGSLKISFDKINEIKLTVNKPVCVYSGRRCFRTENVILRNEIEEIFASFCEYSVHAYKNEIINGYITVKKGIRIGICGTAVYKNDKIENIKYISSINIRMPHEYIGISEKICQSVKKGGILIAGPPCSGKTTLLRDLARSISSENEVIIVDERNEISGMFQGIPGFDVGYCGVMNCFYKANGMEFAVRSMSPDYIVCDEFGSEEDISSAIFAMKSGVKIIASIHASDKYDLIDKPLFDEIIKKRIFEHIVFLNKYYEIYEIVKASEIIK